MNIAVLTKTIDGPDGVSKLYEVAMPPINEIAPIITDKMSIWPPEELKLRAALAGITNNATINKTPTIPIESAVKNAMIIINSNSTRLTLTPSITAKSSFTAMRSSCFQRKYNQIMSAIVLENINMASPSEISNISPNKKENRSIWLLWGMKTNKNSPRDKKLYEQMVIKASFDFSCRKKNKMQANNTLTEIIIMFIRVGHNNPITTPSRDAWEIASAKYDIRFHKTTQPNGHMAHTRQRPTSKAFNMKLSMLFFVFMRVISDGVISHNKE